MGIDLKMIRKINIFRKAFAFTTPALIILALLTSNSIAGNIDNQIREISYLLMCPVCQGQTVAESNSELATQMRAIIKQKLKTKAIFNEPQVQAESKYLEKLDEELKEFES